MKRTVNVKNIAIGDGSAKICIPIVGSTLEQIQEEALYLKTVDFDIVEWRADFYHHVESIEHVLKALSEVRSILPEVPIIFTFRSLKEGGEKEIDLEYYFSINRAVVESGQADIIDIELFNREDDIKNMLEFAHAKQIPVILSNHDFNKTPAKDEIVSRLKKAQELGGDIAKIAVMPQTPADVLTLLDATNTMNEKYADRPIITMSMGPLGVISRLAGEIFGSALTFGAAKKTSAPGQVPAGELKRILDILHT